MHPCYVISDEISQQMNEGIDKMLADEQWHPLHEFLPLGDLVDPEVAARFYRHKDKPVNRPLEEQIMMGRRICVERRLKVRIDNKRAEYQGHGFDKQYRKLAVIDPVDETERQIKNILHRIPEGDRKKFLSRLAARIVEMC